MKVGYEGLHIFAQNGWNEVGIRQHYDRVWRDHHPHSIALLVSQQRPRSCQDCLHRRLFDRWKRPHVSGRCRRNLELPLVSTILTIKGDIVVNGLLVSTFIENVEPVFAHGILAPLRVLNAFGIPFCSGIRWGGVRRRFAKRKTCDLSPILFSHKRRQALVSSRTSFLLVFRIR